MSHYTNTWQAHHVTALASARPTSVPSVLQLSGGTPGQRVEQPGLCSTQGCPLAVLVEGERQRPGNRCLTLTVKSAHCTRQATRGMVIAQCEAGRDPGSLCLLTIQQCAPFGLLGPPATCGNPRRTSHLLLGRRCTCGSTGAACVVSAVDEARLRLEPGVGASAAPIGVRW